MNAERLGSYSRRSTVAVTSHVRRLKSMTRYFCLCPPAIPRDVTWPLLLRPPVLRLPSVSALTGLPFHKADLSTRIRPRRAAEVGLYCLRAISPEPLPSRRSTDLRPGERSLSSYPSAGTACPANACSCPSSSAYSR